PFWAHLADRIGSSGGWVPVALGAVPWWLWLVAGGLIQPASDVGIRRRISWSSAVALGVASFATIALLYTQLSVRIHEEQPENKTVPTWTQLYKDGVLKAFQPRVQKIPKTTGEFDPETGDLAFSD